MLANLLQEKLINRYKITIEYLGAHYCGWQKQKDKLSLQQIIEDSIFKLTKERIVVMAAGRTDAGVHAYGQVVHFDLTRKYDPRVLMNSINHFSRPHTIGVVRAELVNQEFNARFSAQSRHYVYKILNRNATSIIDQGLKYCVRHPLDIDKMQEAANFLVGKHDFSSFRASDCQSNSPIKTLDVINIIKLDNINIEIYFSALSFLHHMVRNIVGSLLMVGKSKWTPSKVKTIMEAQNRAVAGPTAPAHGLYFLKVDY